jgi:aspartyl-tRNA(Asn)/glutamyl-tRNA(Gln) amidotransferase subunit A
MEDIFCLPAHQIVKKVKEREITATQIVEAVYEQIRRVEGRTPTTKYPRGTHQKEFDEQYREDQKKIHAYITLCTEYSLERARYIDERIERGENPGRLAGIPLAVKDILCVTGTPSTAGSKILESFISPYTATAVKRLECEGALIIGKTNLDEFGYGSSNESTAFLPSPGNPWNPTYVPGGSSGGSAAAVSAGEAIIALGSDTSGSIRQPAAFCGVVGMKPTYGRVSRYGLIAFTSSMDCIGPITRNVSDSALMMNIISGRDPRDATTVNLPVPDFCSMIENGVRGLRIGISPDYFRLRYPDPNNGEISEQPIDEEIQKKVMEAAEIFAEAGAEIIDNIPLPTTDFCIPAYFVISRVEAASNLHRYDGVKYGFRTRQPVTELREMYRRTREEGFGLQPQLRILMGIYVSAAQYAKKYYERALRVRTLIRRDFDAIFDKSGKYQCDVLLAPTTPNTAFKMGELYGDSVRMQYADLLTVPANLAGIPALSIPAGLDAKGLPIGIPLLGPHFSEDTILRIGRTFEKCTADEEWRSRKPPVISKRI